MKNINNMELIKVLTGYCENQFYKCEKCQKCTHPSGKCSGGCRECSEEVNYHKPGKRTDYNCQNFMYYYVCRYSWKYCSEIMYALEQIDRSTYPAFNILSVGCGGAPDLMAFEKTRSPLDTREIFYKGYDMNPYWSPIHEVIQQHTSSAQHIEAEFIYKNIFEVLSSGKPAVRHYNVIVLEYLLSHFPPEERAVLANTLFDGLIHNVLPNRLAGSPFLFLINDIDHSEVTIYFDKLLRKLYDNGYTVSLCTRKHFKKRDFDYCDGSVQYPCDKNIFSIPDLIKDKFDCAIKCTSAQLIVEVQ